MELYTRSKCGFESTPNNFHRKTHCKKCQNEYNKKWARDNQKQNKQIRDRSRRKGGVIPMSENKECSMFLGVYVAERVLSNVFNDVEVMPTNNPGFDFICNKGKKIDVKSACLNQSGRSKPRWQFHINQNKTADYFLCLAFDNRWDLNPKYIWLLPAEKFNNYVGVGVSINTIEKWNKYNLPIDKVVACCDVLK